MQLQVYNQRYLRLYETVLLPSLHLFENSVFKLPSYVEGDKNENYMNRKRIDQIQLFYQPRHWHNYYKLLYQWTMTRFVLRFDFRILHFDDGKLFVSLQSFEAWSIKNTFNMVKSLSSVMLNVELLVLTWNVVSFYKDPMWSMILNLQYINDTLKVVF